MPPQPSTSTLPLDVHPGKPLILSVSANGDAASWAAENRDAVLSAVATHGALLVRGLGLRDAAGTGSVFRSFGRPMIDREAFAPRLSLADGVHSATKWPPNLPMRMHHELSYALEFPGLIMFACLTAPTSGGATPVADASAVLRALPVELVERFERVGWLLARNHNGEFGASVAEVFGTDDGRRIESYCRANAIEYEWRGDGWLHTRQRRAAVLAHPRGGQSCWFNQVAFLNRWTLDPELRESLVGAHGDDGLPFDTCFGDGEPIDEPLVNAIHQAYETCTVREPWQAGDLLLVDNIRTAHGREAFAGPREVLVGLAEPVRVAWEARS